jgi:murein DD-endopeptidase MepM/ murein hydrolase activator NlpD
MNSNSPVLFPTLEGESFCEIDLPAASKRWIARQRRRGRLPSDGANPLLDWARFQEFRDDYHREGDATWSLGGYGENRSEVLYDTYLAVRGKFIHLGVDCFVDAHTPVALCRDAKVLHIYHEDDNDVGWGTRVIVELADTFPAMTMVYGHLKRALAPHVRLNRVLRAGTIIAEVGEEHENGNLPPHLHIQALMKRKFLQLLRDKKLTDRRGALDGYCTERHRKRMLRACPDPLPYVNLGDGRILRAA